MREVLAGLERDDADARLAYDVYVHRLRSSIGAMAASLGGLDALVFTGGVGEHSSRVRADACSGLGHLGLTLDTAANDAAAADAVVGEAILVVTSREDRQIACETRLCLAE
jgi:acetate kinase